MVEHTRSYCTLCQDWTVICKTCGNNSCNGGAGTLPDGSDCPDCEEAYQIMMNPYLMESLEES